MADISKIKLPSGITYNIKDEVARQMASAGVSFIISTNAANTPKDVTWDDSGVTITGTLVASASTTGVFYLVKSTTPGGNDIYAEYATVMNRNGYSWEKIGTMCDISEKVNGPVSSGNGTVALFDGTTGKAIKDSGFTIGCSVPENAKFTDTTYFEATTSTAGLMSATDKQKLDELYGGDIFGLSYGQLKARTAISIYGLTYGQLKAR